MQDKGLEDSRTLYEKGGRHENWGNLSPLIRLDAYLTAQMLKKAQVIPHPKTKDEKIIILSPSSNVGFYEAMMRTVFGNEYIIIAGDIAKIERFKHDQAAHIQLDANLLPFPNQSLNVIFDRQGALWHAAFADLRTHTDLKTFKLLKEFHTKLKYGGLLITDHQVDAKIPTGLMIDNVLKHRIPDGFMKPYIIGETNWQYRVYKTL